MKPILLSVATLALALTSVAGCIDDDADRGSEVPPGHPVVDALLELAFSPKQIIDDTRAGGEPVIAVSQSGAIFVSSHPGWTHYHPSEPTHPGLELVTPASAQSYLWKSTDGGTTWRHIGLEGREEGPRSTGFGVSDPEFTVMADGTICYTDLEALASSSVSCSTDDGETWVGNPVASQRPNDRQWLASHGDELYFTANYFTDHNILASTDRGLTWEMRGDVPCSYDLVADPADGALIVGCSDGIAVSLDGGHTWEERQGPVEGVRRDMTEPAIDSAGNIWMAWANATEDETLERIVVAGTPDRGATWPWVYDLGEIANGVSPTVNGTLPARVVGNDTTPAGAPHVWPWVSAGSEGRLAVTWIGTYDAEAETTTATDWHVFTTYLVDAHTDDATVAFMRVSDEPVHQRPICQSGTMCQVESMQGNAAGDRRLGDFFETTLDLEGNLHIVVSDTVAKPEHVVSHVAYFRQAGGLPLLIEGDRPPTQG